MVSQSQGGSRAGAAAEGGGKAGRRAPRVSYNEDALHSTAWANAKLAAEESPDEEEDKPAPRSQYLPPGNDALHREVFEAIILTVFSDFIVLRSVHVELVI